MPINVQVVAPCWQDETVLAVMKVIEKEFEGKPGSWNQQELKNFTV